MPRPADDDAIGDVHSLFGDDPPRREPPRKPHPAPVDPDDAGGYDLMGGDPEPEPEPAAAGPVPPVLPPSSARPRSKPQPDPVSEPDDDDSGPEPAGEPARVDQVWSRWAEWGPTLRNLAIAAVVWFGVFYFAVASVQGFLIVGMLGVVALLVLAYPIAITLERPVRMTPEQAVRDYFNALAHVRPHYRRMWLLLSSAGRDGRDYHDFAGFQAYWKRTLARLRGGKPGAFAPIAVEVQDFPAGKSAGKATIKAKFTLRILDPNAPGSPLASYRMAIGLVRGPDKMWYLNDGALPTAEDG